MITLRLKRYKKKCNIVAINIKDDKTLKTNRVFYEFIDGEYSNCGISVKQYIKDIEGYSLRSK